MVGVFVDPQRSFAKGFLACSGLVILPEYKNTFGDQGPQIQGRFDLPHAWEVTKPISPGFIVAAQFIGNLVVCISRRSATLSCSSPD